MGKPLFITTHTGSIPPAAAQFHAHIVSAGDGEIGKWIDLILEIVLSSNYARAKGLTFHKRSPFFRQSRSQVWSVPPIERFVGKVNRAGDHRRDASEIK